MPGVPVHGNSVALTAAHPSDLAVRSLIGELMDDPAIDPAKHRGALRALARMNSLAAGHRVLWPAIRALAAIPGHPTLRVLDIATGSGDIPVRLIRRARSEGVSLSVDACDTSEVALAEARERAARSGVAVNFFRLDAIAANIPDEYDVVTCSLFLHHLPDDTALDLLYKMRCAARQLVLVSDLVRSRAGLILATVIPRLLSRSHVVQVDAVRSVRAAFTPDEMEILATEAGMGGATVSRCWPQRMLLRWSRE